MSAGKKLRLTLGFALVCILSVFGHERVGGDDENMKNTNPVENVEEDERLEYLAHLLAAVRRQAEEKGARGQHDDAIKLIEEHIGKLEDSDYEKYPVMVAGFYFILSEANFEPVMKYRENVITSARIFVELHEKSGSPFNHYSATLMLARRHRFLGNWKQAEENFKKAIALAERIPLDPLEDDIHGNSQDIFIAKESLMLLYMACGRIDDAKEIARELELMIENEQITGYTKEDVRCWFDKESSEKKPED